MHFKATTRMPTGEIHNPCPRCSGNVVGGRASQKYRREVTFVHVYRDRQHTGWIATLVYHPDCWEQVDRRKLKKELLVAA